MTHLDLNFYSQNRYRGRTALVTMVVSPFRQVIVSRRHYWPKNRVQKAFMQKSASTYESKTTQTETTQTKSEKKQKN